MFAVLISIPGTAQRLVLRAGLGHALPLSNSRPVYLTGFPYTGGSKNPSDNAMFEVKKASMFSGTRAVAAVGFMFPRIGFEIAAATVISAVEYKVATSLGDVYPAGSETHIRQSITNPTLLLPSAVMNIPGKKLDVSVRAGLALPLHARMQVESETFSNGNRFYDRSELRASFGFGLAFSGGVEYKITSKLRAGLAIDIITMTLKAKQLTLKESLANGESTFPDKLAYEKQTRYVDDMSSYTFSSDAPRQAPGYSIPFGTKGLSLAISMIL